MSIATIVVTLGKLEKMHKSLLELALAKTEYIKQGDMEKLDQLIKSEQAHVAAINTLEQQRQAMVTDYLRAKGIALTDTPSVADVIKAAENGESTKELVSVRERLIALLDQLKMQNDLNQKLVMNSLQFINITLDAMRPQQRTEQFNYSGAEVRGNAEVAKRSFNEFKA
ncbi:flagellar protein FlgN [Solibacillus isronensis]|uniref:flagellar protein FlgN n=1 Tax=Solibacillus isronensis TaxID=412383 RepID=UPI0009A6D2D3|nr:flagellar protein FlgN [Solibacillus isronensis]